MRSLWLIFCIILGGGVLLFTMINYYYKSKRNCDFGWTLWFLLLNLLYITIIKQPLFLHVCPDKDFNSWMITGSGQLRGDSNLWHTGSVDDWRAGRPADVFPSVLDCPLFSLSFARGDGVTSLRSHYSLLKFETSLGRRNRPNLINRLGSLDDDLMFFNLHSH